MENLSSRPGDCKRYWPMNRTLILVPLLLVLAPSAAYAHSFAVYVSTPATPPSGYEWVRFASLGVIAATLVLCHWLIAKRTLLNSAFTALGTTIGFWLVFVFVGNFAASTSTAPPPGLGPPSAIYWHRPAGSHWSLFAFWNILGAGFLIFACLLVGRLWKLTVRARIALLVAPVIAYTLFLSPFVSSNAITHGWAGGYVMNAGDDQLYDLNRACLLYAEQNDGRFPVAQNIEELLPQITEHLEHKESRYGNPITVHPAAWAFEEQPKPFTWDSSLSGRDAPELPVWNGSQLPVQCPYIGNRVRPIHDLTEGQ